VKGDVVVVPFPFSDLSQAKRRPALVLAQLLGDDLILCQITSQMQRDNYSVALHDDDFESGGLRHVSNARPNRLFSADERLILYQAVDLKAGSFKRSSPKRSKFCSDERRSPYLS
jgi:mRNA interferase MazF